MVSGPDGGLWFTERSGVDTATKIAKITTTGAITEYAAPNGGAACMTAGPDGALWFGEINKIGRITTSGLITEYAVSGSPESITSGPDGGLWFTESSGGNWKIARITTDGVVTAEYNVPPPPAGRFRTSMLIVSGPDGALWFLDTGVPQIGRITTAGVFTFYPITTAAASITGGITAGRDGAIWFTESGINKFGRITTTGTLTEYPVLSESPIDITAGLDGSVWFTETGSKIGRITPAGAITEYSVAEGALGGNSNIAAGADGAVWFTGSIIPGNGINAGIIGRAAVGSGVSSIAQLASGGSWTTTITLANPGASSAQITLNFLDDNGDPLPLPLIFPQGSIGPITDSTYTSTINANAELIIQSRGSAAQATQVGWAQVITNGSITGLAEFSQAISASVQEALVPLETRTPGGFIIPFDNLTFATGVALASVADQSGSISVTIRDDTGTTLGTDSIVLGVHGHTSFNLATRYPITAGHRGTIEFDKPINGQISVVGIRFNSTGAFSSISAIAK